ncbi:hypothetical protein GALL_494570 [mine drainage metagenome]|uniref:Uncharacterized protein n=1 Tax=mine drainage metagenome TaxID=410659 RepID=A0A1J5PDU7_9ZZZZ
MTRADMLTSSMVCNWLCRLSVQSKQDASSTASSLPSGPQMGAAEQLRLAKLLKKCSSR